jgi:23S rRNA-/tRNA-specific pseudouridylate synthase
LIGLCCGSSDFSNELSRSRDALEYLDIIDRHSHGHHNCWKPDIVSLSLAYTALHKSYPEMAPTILHRAEKLSPSSTQSFPTNQGDSINKYWKEIFKQTYDMTILYDHPEFLILNKPSGVSLQTIQEVILEQGVPLSDLNPDGSRGFVHRLDRGTSGCVTLAKTNAMHAVLISQFFLRLVRKTYIAMVCNPIPSSHHSNDDHSIDGLQLSGTIQHPIEARPAESFYEVIDDDFFLGNSTKLISMLRITTNQGRKHQVRRHCSKGLQRPIVLDQKYGGEKIMYMVKSKSLKEARSQQKLCLHASHLSFQRLGVEVEASLPLWWNGIIRDIDAPITLNDE